MAIYLLIRLKAGHGINVNKRVYSKQNREETQPNKKLCTNRVILDKCDFKDDKRARKFAG